MERERVDRNVASCSRLSTTVIGPLHECKKVCSCNEQKPYPSQAVAHELRRSEEEGKERKRDRKDRGQEADGKMGSPTVASFINFINLS